MLIFKRRQQLNAKGRDLWRNAQAAGAEKEPAARKSVAPLRAAFGEKKKKPGCRQAPGLWAEFSPFREKIPRGAQGNYRFYRGRFIVPLVSEIQEKQKAGVFKKRVAHSFNPPAFYDLIYLLGNAP